MFKKLFVVLGFSVILSACQFQLPFIKPKKAGLQITSTPQATVMLGGTSLGNTPLVNENLDPGQYTLKITPNDPTLPPWQTTITLNPKILTAVDRKLSSDPNQNHGYILSFEKLSSRQDTQLAVSTLPDTVNVTVDGSPKGFAPTSIETIQPGQHMIALTSPGFEDKTITARTIEGYRLTVSAQLAQATQLNDPVLGTQSAQPNSTPSASPSQSSQYSIQVLNGTGTPGQAGQAKELLQQAQFETITIGNAPSYDYRQTQISLHPDSPSSLYQSLKTALQDSFPATQSAQLDSTSSFDAVIITGKTSN